MYSEEIKEIQTKVEILGKRVLIKPLEADKTTSGGILISEESQEQKHSGIIIAIGSKVEENTFTTGEKVFYDKYSETILEIDEKNYSMVDTDYIFMKLK